MKCLRAKSEALWFAVCLGSSGVATAYEVNTHANMSESATRTSTGLLQQLPNLGLSSITDTLTSAGRTQTIIDWIREGAKKEDDTLSEQFARYKNHFYDPINGNGFGGILYRDSGFISGMPAPDWVLDKGPADNQLYSYRQARQYLYDSLTKPVNADRNSNLALMFRTLGNVGHVVQDLAQPQHTRNDGHGDGSLYEHYTGDQDKRGNLPYSNPSVPIPLHAMARDFLTNGDGTGLAQYSNANFVSVKSNFEGGLGNMQASRYYAYPVPTGPIETVSVLDLDVNRAIKDYCGQSPACTMRFVSSANSHGEVRNRAATVSIFADAIDSHNVTNLPGDFNPYFSLNRFNFDAAHPALIPRAVAYFDGLLNYFFRGAIDIEVPPEGVYALADHALELVNAKDTGGFATLKARVRNTTPGMTQPAGSAGVPQFMDTTGIGKLVAVIKFHRNDCYKPDLSGEYRANGGTVYAPDNCNMPPCPPTVQIGTTSLDSGGTNVGWPLADCPSGGASYQTPTEEIVVSQPVNATTDINSTDPAGGQLATFSFSPPIPINARDLYLQIVYRGPLGAELDAVVVGTKAISEPSYEVIGNVTDYMLCINGTYYRNNPDGSLSIAEQNAILALGGSTQDFNDPQYLPQTNNKIVVAIRPPYNYDGLNPPFPSLDPLTVDPNLNIAASKDNLAPGQYLRLAFLTDYTPDAVSITPNAIESAAADVSIGTNEHWYFWTVSPVTYNVNKRDSRTGTNIASANAIFRDFRVSNWYMTYKTYFKTTNCFNTLQTTINHDNASPSQLVPFTTLTFGGS